MDEADAVDDPRGMCQEKRENQRRKKISSNASNIFKPTDQILRLPREG